MPILIPPTHSGLAPPTNPHGHGPRFENGLWLLFLKCTLLPAVTGPGASLPTLGDTPVLSEPPSLQCPREMSLPVTCHAVSMSPSLGGPGLVVLVMLCEAP